MPIKELMQSQLWLHGPAWLVHCKAGVEDSSAASVNFSIVENELCQNDVSLVSVTLKASENTFNVSPWSSLEKEHNCDDNAQTGHKDRPFYTVAPISPRAALKQIV